MTLMLTACSEQPVNDGIIPQSQQSIVEQQVSDQWDTSIIRSKGNSGTTSMLTLLPTGSHVAFFDTSAQSTLYYAYKGTAPTDIWNFTNIETFGGASQHLSMQVVNTDDVRVAYFNGFNLKFARKPSGGSTFTSVMVDNSNNAGIHASFTMLGGSTYAIAYQKCILNCNQPFEFLSRELMVATSTNGTSWQTEEVEDVPFNQQPLTSFGWGAKAFENETGNLSVVAYDGQFHKLYMYDHSGPFNSFASWSKTEIETIGNLVEDVSVAIDATTGLTAIAYYDDANRVLKVATRNGVGQPFNIQTAIATGNVGSDNSIAIRSSDQTIGVSCYNGDLEGLNFVIRSPAGVWQEPELVHADSDSGRASSLVFSDDGIAHISHYQLIYGDLLLSSRKVAP